MYVRFVFHTTFFTEILYGSYFSEMQIDYVLLKLCSISWYIEFVNDIIKAIICTYNI